MKKLVYLLALLLLISGAAVGGFWVGRAWVLKEQQTVRVDTRVHVQSGDKPEPVDGWITPALYTEKITWRFTGVTKKNPKTAIGEAYYVYTLELKNIYGAGKPRGYKVRMHFLFVDKAELVLYESPVVILQFPISEPNYIHEFDGSGWVPLGLVGLINKAGWRGEMEPLESSP